MKIRNKLLALTILPILALGIVCIAVCVSQFILYSNKEAQSELYGTTMTVSCVIDQLYPGDYDVKDDCLTKGSYTLNGRIELFDILKAQTGLEYSLFYNDKRVATTFMDKTRYMLGSTLNDDIWSQLKRGADFESSIINMNGATYFSCYIPITDNKNNIVGAIGVAKDRSEVKVHQRQIITPICFIILVLMVLIGLLALSIARDFAGCIEGIKDFVNQTANEKFTARLPENIYSRKDELGEIGKDIATMRNTLRDMIELDGLTQLYNKRTGNKKFEGLRNKCIMSNRPYCLGMGDIDFFKKVNDTYGHEAGDEVLRTIASIIKRHMKGHGFVARWGGEEFMLGFDGLDKGESRELIEGALNEIRNTVVHYDDQDIKVTMTFGIVTGKKKSSSEELFKIADNRLYIGKENGRNQIVTRG